MSALAPFLPRAVALLVAYIALRFGITLEDERAQQIAIEILNVVTLFIGIYFPTHRGLSKLWNPGDAASSHVADEEKMQANMLKHRSTPRR